MGWTEIPRYSFRVPPGWQETPVSIADLGGTGVAACLHHACMLTASRVTSCSSGCPLVEVAQVPGWPAEIDLRFGNKEAGSMEIVVAPVLRFMEEPPKVGWQLKTWPQE